jgi:hypothetical protein
MFKYMSAWLHSPSMKVAMVFVTLAIMSAIKLSWLSICHPCGINKNFWSIYGISNKIFLWVSGIINNFVRLSRLNKSFLRIYSINKNFLWISRINNKIFLWKFLE